MSNMDPVCGMEIDHLKDEFKHEYKGKPYYFCSEHCFTAFKNDPERFLNGETAEVAASRGEKPLLGRPFTCPAHRGVLQDCPGRCFQCGAVLVRVGPFYGESFKEVKKK